jgi:hypothetical protein
MRDARLSIVRVQYEFQAMFAVELQDGRDHHNDQVFLV